LRDPDGLKQIRNLDYVILLCDDIKPMKSFYQEIMGFEIYREEAEWVAMKIP
jgi:catechol 2,3-dioxygenase-like lactoylglutathione lyase family enzyme